MTAADADLPQVAIITRTQNRPLLLRRCIRSVLAQTFDDWVQVVVNDGGNPKDVARVVEEFRPAHNGRIVVYNHVKSRGMEAASNTGIKRSRSRYVAFLDDDDTWDEKFLAEMTAALETASETIVKGVVCQTGIVKETIEHGEIAQETPIPFNTNLRSIQLSELIRANRFTNNAFLYERDVYQKIGMYKENMEALGDWEFNIRFFLNYDAVVIPKQLAHWHWRMGVAAPADVNSVHAAKDPHQFWRTKLINDALRGKWLKNQQHLALILVLGSDLDQLRSQLNDFSADRLTAEAARNLLQQLEARINATIESRAEAARNLLQQLEARINATIESRTEALAADRVTRGHLASAVEEVRLQLSADVGSLRADTRTATDQLAAMLSQVEALRIETGAAIAHITNALEANVGQVLRSFAIEQKELADRLENKSHGLAQQIEKARKELDDARREIQDSHEQLVQRIRDFSFFVQLRRLLSWSRWKRLLSFR